MNLEENLRVLRSILECYSRQQDSYGMRSLAMQDVVAKSGSVGSMVPIGYKQ